MSRRLIIAIATVGVVSAASVTAFLLRDRGAPNVAATRGSQTDTTEVPDQGVLVDLPRLVESSTRYEPEAIAELILGLAVQAEEALSSGRFPINEERFLEVFDPLTLAASAREAVRCARSSAGEDSLAPFYVEIANFQAQPAYVVAFLSAPDAISLFDRLVIWAVDRGDCAPLHVAFQRL